VVFAAAVSGPGAASSQEAGAKREVFTPVETTNAGVADIRNGSVVLDAPSYPGLRFSTIQRDRDGEAEVHTLANEHVYVVAGEFEWEVGGRVTGNRNTAPDEWRGGQIEGGRRYKAKPGDMMYIPAGVPHRVRLAPGVKLVRYLVVKVNTPPS
jgi:quercetin dioxygenase-like cupin family protein